VAVNIKVLQNDIQGTNDLFPSTLNVTIAPAHGVATPIAGEIRYTPTWLYYGSDSFEYVFATPQLYYAVEQWCL
jgi:hypothetical protein